MAGKGLPSSLRSLNPYLTIYKQFIEKDPIISYYAAMHVVREGIVVGKDTEAKTYLLSLMDTLESLKKALAEEEAVTNELVGQAHVEMIGLKLFDHADSEDRRANFNKNMIKAFFTSFHIFSIAKDLGDLSEEVEAKQKYAKWKAVEIDRCLKNGIAPTPGPPGQTELTEDGSESDREPSPKPTPKPRQNFSQQPVIPGPASDQQPVYPPPDIGPPGHQMPYPPVVGQQPLYPPPDSGQQLPYPPVVGQQPLYPPPDSGQQLPYPPVVGQQPLYPSTGVQPQYQHEPTLEPSATSGTSPEDISEAQRKCKFASSALDYDDVTGAIAYLTEALHLLRKQ